MPTKSVAEREAKKIRARGKKAEVVRIANALGPNTSSEYFVKVSSKKKKK